MALRIKYKKEKILWPIQILRYTLPILSFGFYGQIYLIFTTIFYCRKKESKTSPYLKCRPQIKKLKFPCGLAVLLHFLIAFITNKLYYQPLFIRSDSDLLKKSNSSPDIILVFTKIIVITIFIMDKGEESEHWAIISFLVFVTGINAYFTLFYKNRKNHILLNLNNFMSLVLFSGFVILFIGKIFKFLKFNGSIFLFFSCLFIIIIFIIIYKNNEIDFISTDYKSIDDPYEFLQYIYYFIFIIKNKNNSRNYSTIMKSLIISIEENCLLQNCPLKKYLLNLEKGFDFDYILFQFCEKLFKYGILKFKENILLKNHYSIFLLTEMNNKTKALIILEEIKDEILSLENNYIIYRCRKIVENYTSPFINQNSSLFDYKKNSQNFKIYIEKATILYYDFFSLLLESKLRKTNNNFEKINKTGYKIKKLNKLIANSFDNLINFKTDNFEIINLYSEFVENILKDEKIIEKCQNLKKISYNSKLNEVHEIDYSNYNLDYLKANFNLNYLTISTKNKSLGKILDCSHNCSSIIGYQRNELIGNSINILIPEIYRKKHNLLLMQKTEENKLNFLQGLYNNIIYSPKFIQKDTFCISKSKLLTSLNIKIYLVNSEDNELVYIAEIEKNDYDNKLLNNEDNSKYCILTDKNFIIQSFTPNCINFLNINYEEINSNCHIMNYIKQFRDDYIASIKTANLNKFSQIRKTGLIPHKNSKIIKKQSNDNKISYRQRQKLKKDLINKKYLKKCKITWSNHVESFLDLTQSGKASFRLKYSIFTENENNLDEIKNKVEINLSMDPKKVIIDKELIGYYFTFSKIIKEKKNFLFSKTIHEKFSEKNVIKQKLKKYQVIIKPQNFLTENSLNKTGIFKNIEDLEVNKENKEKQFFRKMKRSSIEKMIQKVKSKDEENNNNLAKRRLSKISSASLEKIAEINTDEEIILNEEYIPQSQVNFIFNVNNIAYDFTNKIDGGYSLNEILKREAINKIKNFNRLASIQFKKENKSSSLSSYNSSGNSEFEFESNDYSSSDSFSFSKKSFYSELNENKTTASQKEENLEANSIKIKKVEEINEINKNESLDNKLDILNNYYKVKLNKILLMKYDFDKEIVVEESTQHKNITRIEEFLISYRKKNSKNKGKEEYYSFLSLNKNKTIKKEHSKNYKNYSPRKNKEKKNIVENRSNIIINKIKEAIHNYNEEKPIRNLRILTAISFIYLISTGLINLLYNLNFYSSIKELYILNRHSLYLKYCNLISIYYIRELTLLNFNYSDIEGGEYIKFPDKNKTEYLSLLKNKLVQLFIDNQLSMKTIFSSSITLSKNTSKYFSKKMITTEFVLLNYDMEKNENNIFTTLLQYNNAFFFLAFSEFPINQNDAFEYMHNSFNGYNSGLNLLISLYNFEYGNQTKNLIYFVIIFLIIILIIFIFIYILGVKYFLSSNLRRISYIEVFYCMNSQILENCILNCSNLLQKFKHLKNDNKYFNEYYEFENSNENTTTKNDSIKEKNRINDYSKNSLINENEDNKNKKALSYINKLFKLFFGIFLIMIYSYFLLTYRYQFMTLNDSISISHFSHELFKYQFNIIDMYNVYREYIFDNLSIISSKTPYEYLINKENEVYENIIQTIKNINNSIQYYLQTGSEIRQTFDRHLCSYNTTHYFGSINECINKFGNIVELDFFNLMDYFFEQIRIKKNILKYILNNNNIFGNLTKYNSENWTYLILNNNNTKNIFRLNLFNDEILHFNLNLLFFNIILPFLQSTQKVIMNTIKIEGENFYFILWFIIYILALSVIFFACLIPLIKFLNEQIYKTKNILSIIPIDFLVYNNNSLINLFIDN